MSLSELDLLSVEYVCLNLRSDDATEIYGVRPHSSPVMLAHEAYNAIKNAGRGRVAWWQGKPAAVVGLYEHRKGVWEICLFGTNEFKNVAFICMRWARETLRELTRDFGCVRVFCDSRVGHDEAWRFLTALGAVKEGPPMRHFGKDGGDYQRFVWILGENDHVLHVKTINAKHQETRQAAN